MKSVRSSQTKAIEVMNGERIMPIMDSRFSGRGFKWKPKLLKWLYHRLTAYKARKMLYTIVGPKSDLDPTSTLVRWEIVPGANILWLTTDDQQQIAILMRKGGGPARYSIGKKQGKWTWGDDLTFAELVKQTKFLSQ